MTKKSKKKILEQDKVSGVLEEIKSYEYKPEDELLVTKESQQKLIKKIEEIEILLEKQGLGQNARRKVFVLFEDLRKLKCDKHKCVEG